MNWAKWFPIVFAFLELIEKVLAEVREEDKQAENETPAGVDTPVFSALDTFKTEVAKKVDKA